MEYEHKAFKASVQPGGEGEITALVSCFGNTDHANERVIPGAFKASLQKKLPRMCWAHDWSKPIGKTLEAYETAEGLVVKAKLNLETQAGKEAYSNLKFMPLDFSIGYSVVKDSFDEKGVRNLVELSCHEFSPVLVGMNPNTQLLSIKSNEVRMQVDEVTRANRPNFGGNPDPKGEHGGSNYGNVFDFPRKGVGQQFIESKQYQDFLRGRCHGESDAVTIDVSVKTLMTTTTGWPVENTRTSLVVPYPTRPIQLVDILPTIQTRQNAFVYMSETLYDNTATEVAEGNLKPEAALALEQVTMPIRKVAVHVPVTDEQLEDVPEIQTYIENRLSLMARQRVDSQLLVGTGTTPEIQGLLTLPGVQSYPKGAGEPIPDAVYYAKTMAETIGQAFPNYVLLNPLDFAKVRLLRTSDGMYIWGNPSEKGPETMWDIPVIKCQALPQGVGIVGDFANYSLLVERKGLSIKVGYSGTQFIENTRTVLAELRIAAVWTRPQAFCLVTNL